MFCNNCGSKIPDNSKFCNECGYAIPAEVINRKQSNKQKSETKSKAENVENKAQATSSSTKEHKKNNVVISLIICVFVFVVGYTCISEMFVGSFTQNKNAESTNSSNNTSETTISGSIDYYKSYEKNTDSYTITADIFVSEGDISRINGTYKCYDKTEQAYQNCIDFSKQYDQQITDNNVTDAKISIIENESNVTVFYDFCNLTDLANTECRDIATGFLGIQYSGELINAKSLESTFLMEGFVEK